MLDAICEKKRRSGRCRSGLAESCFARKPSSGGAILDRRYGVNSQPALTDERPISAEVGADVLVLWEASCVQFTVAAGEAVHAQPPQQWPPGRGNRIDGSEPAPGRQAYAQRFRAHRRAYVREADGPVGRVNAFAALAFGLGVSGIRAGFRTHGVE
jgi:hypothetical protein